MAKYLARKSLTVKLVFAIVVVSILLTIVSSLIQVFFLLRVETQKVESRLNIIETTYLESIARSVWSFDEALLETQLYGIKQLPDIEVVELWTNLGDVYRKGERVSENILQREYKVLYEDENKHNLGMLKIVASTDSAIKRLKNEFGYTLMAEAIKISLTALIILLIIRQLITSRLNQVAKYTESMSLENLTHDRDLYRKLVYWEDEISDVTIALNSMRRSIKHGVETLNKAYDKLHESEQKFKALVNNIPGAIYRCRYNDERETVFMSDAVMQITGHSKYEFLNQELRLEILIDKTHLINVQREISRSALEGKSYRLEYKIHDANNNEKWLYDCGAAIQDNEGNIAYLDGVLFDITDKKLLEQSLQQFNEQLEVRVQQRTVELERTNDELKSAQSKLVESEKMASLGGMVAGVAHEINTPIGVGITAVSHLITQTTEFFETLKAGKLTRAQFDHYHKMTSEGLDIISRNLSRIAALVKSFKMVAVDQSSQERRQFFLKEYLEDVALTLKPKLKRYRHELIIECPDSLSLNSFPSAIYQIFTNLIMNSLNHAFDDIDKGTMKIIVSLEETTVVMRYSDDGQGMSKDVQKEIFTPFFTTSRHKGGSGLGMHIVYNLVTQVLKGEIDVDSEQGNGVTFTITCPLEH